MKDVSLYIVLAYKRPGPTLKQVSDPVDRMKAAKIVASHWNMGRMARLVCASSEPATPPEGIVIWPEKFQRIRQQQEQARDLEKRGAA